MVEDANTKQGVEEVKSQPSGLNESQESKRENTRSRIATVYVVGFLLIVGFTLSIGLFRLTVSENRDMLITISGILSGPLGFIIGYYFKASQEK